MKVDGFLLISLAYPAIFYPNTLDAFALAPQFFIAHASKREEIRLIVRDVVLQLASDSRVASMPGAILQFTTRQSHEGPCTYDVRKILRIFDPPLHLVRTSCNLLVLFVRKIRQFLNPPPPSVRTSYVHCP